MNPNPNQNDEPLIRHLTALRAGLVRSVFAVLVCLGGTAFFARSIYQLLSKPLQDMLPKGSHFITLHPVEAWYTYFKTALYAAFFLALPWIFFEVWRFVSPGLYQREKKTVVWCALLSSLCFMAGGFFGYFIALPAGFRYFNSVLDNTDILFLPRMEDYLGFALQMLLAFGLVFELPLLLLMLNIAGLVSANQIRAFRRYYIVVAFIIAAILTPPDILSQLIMAAPLIGLYEVGIILCLIKEKSTSKVQQSHLE